MATYTSTVLITGGTAGLGVKIAKWIAKSQPESLIIIASRSSGDDAARKINAELGRSNVKFMALDLVSTTNVRNFVAKFIAAEYPPISALVLNAGLHFPGAVEFNEEKIEKTFAINHLGNALVFYLLKDHLTPDARILVTGSGTHDPAQKTAMPNPSYTTAAEVAHPNADSPLKNGQCRYATSKLCNILWMYALDRHIKAAGKAWTAAAVDPGLMPGTGLGREYPALIYWVWCHILPRLVWLLRIVMDPNIHTTEESGKAYAEVAVGMSAGSVVAGTYYEGTKPIKSSKDSYDEKKQEDLWDFTVKTLAKDEAEQASFDF